MAFDPELYFADELIDRFDIVGFDPRGVAGSEPEFACGTDREHAELIYQIEGAADTPEEVELGTQAVQLCLDSMGPVAMRMHSAFVARDMDEIRKGLGAEQISYLGISYGSALGGWYASIFPERVYSMVVDGAANPAAEVTTIEQMLEERRRLFGPIHTQLAEALSSCNEVCPIWNDGDPLGYWYETAGKFGLVQDDNDGDPFSPYLGFIGFLYNEAAWPSLHDATYALGENADPSGFSDAILAAPEAPGGANITAHINCLDTLALFPERTLELQVANLLSAEDDISALFADELPLINAVGVPEEPGACPFYSEFDAPVFEGTFDGGGIPILVVGNLTDPVTPYTESRDYANDVLADGRLVKVEHSAHGVYPSNACVIDLVHSALIDQQYPTEEVTCEDPGLGATNMVVLELSEGGTTLRPEGWIEIAPDVFAKGNPAVDPLIGFFPTEGDTADALGFVAEQYGATPELGGEVEINGVVWELYGLDSEDGGLAVRVGVSSGENGHMVLGHAAIEDIDAMTGKVLMPALENFVLPE